MPQQTDPAVPTRLASITGSMNGRKLRIAGRMLSYDEKTGIILLGDGNDAVLVDVSLSVDSWKSTWARERKALIMVIGHLEQSSEPYAIPMLPAYAAAPQIDPYLLLTAILVTQAGDLDMRSWNAAIEDREAA